MARLHDPGRDAHLCWGALVQEALHAAGRSLAAQRSALPHLRLSLPRIGGLVARTLFGLVPSKMNPQLCNTCRAAAMTFRGGAEVEMSLLFADVRGSATIAENQSPAEFSRLIDRFYQATAKVLYKKSAQQEKLIGDEVTAFFVPGIAGPDHARLAIEAGEEILRVTGHANLAGPWVLVGVGAAHLPGLQAPRGGHKGRGDSGAIARRGCGPV